MPAISSPDLLADPACTLRTRGRPHHWHHPRCGETAPLETAMNLMRPRSRKQMREPMEHIVRHAGCKQAEPGEEKPHHSERSGAVNERDHARDDGSRGQHDADLIRSCGTPVANRPSPVKRSPTTPSAPAP